MKTKRMLKNIISVTLMLVILSLSGCGENDSVDMTISKPIIAVTIIPQKTFVEAVCGELAEVIALIPPGHSPENYEPAPAAIEKISDAALYFTVGVQAEKAGILGDFGDIKIISLEEEVAAVYPERTFGPGERDPHIWLSPKRVKIMIEIILRELITLDPANQITYENNAAAYISQLNELDEQINSALEGVKNKKFIVYHPAFGYIADDYGLIMYSLEEEGKEATARHLQDMIDLAKNENIKAIFYQEEIDSRQSAAFAEEIGGKTIQLSPLDADYISNLKNMAKILAEVLQ
ncbi:MAG: metal ABC transporter solute-binding protein, Zn/Mn family [Eubacteriales bacterium]